MQYSSLNTSPNDQNESSTIKHDNNLLVLGASVQGQGHKLGTFPIPCQDNHNIISLPNQTVISVVCDGAGSSKHSDIGSELVSSFAAKSINEWLSKYPYDSRIPPKSEWLDFIFNLVDDIYNHLIEYATKNDISLRSLACTMIAGIFTPDYCLITNIGDGRAALHINNDWIAIIHPFQGIEKGEAIFVTSPLLYENKDIRVKLVRVELYEGNIKAFALMSDGFEKHSFICSILDEKSNKWSDPNIPYPGFLNPVRKTLKDYLVSKTEDSVIKQNWIDLIKTGNQRIKSEHDDKTLIFGIFES